MKSTKEHSKTPPNQNNAIGASAGSSLSRDQSEQIGGNLDTVTVVSSNRSSTSSSALSTFDNNLPGYDQAAQPNDQLISSQTTIPTLPSTYVSSTSDSIISPQDNLQTMFPCLHPVNPHMRCREARLQTFLDRCTVWPSHRIRASPQQFADAGMYYLGYIDRVKCWYCNGPLQHWERDHIPWDEHAKWFPWCEYLLQQKGTNYVDEIDSRFPGLERPVFIASDDESTENDVMPSLPVIIDPRKELQDIQIKVEHDFKISKLITEARKFGASDTSLREALRKQYIMKGQAFSDFESLIDALSKLEILPEEDETTSSRYDTSTAVDELKMLEMSMRCKKCQKEEANVMFIPCGHLSCCVKCVEKCKTCPLCKEFVREKLRCIRS